MSIPGFCGSALADSFDDRVRPDGWNEVGRAMAGEDATEAADTPGSGEVAVLPPRPSSQARARRWVGSTGLVRIDLRASSVDLHKALSSTASPPPPKSPTLGEVVREIEWRRETADRLRRLSATSFGF